MAPRYDTAAWDPWTAAELMDVKIRLIAMAGGLLGACDWYSRSIYIRSGITAGQTLCAVAHEVKHMERGTLMCGGSERLRRREEALISREVAQLLIPFPRLVDAVAWSPHLDEQAAVLGVDRFTVRTRLENLADWEAEQLRSLFGEVVA